MGGYLESKNNFIAIQVFAANPGRNRDKFFLSCDFTLRVTRHSIKLGSLLVQISLYEFVSPFSQSIIQDISMNVQA